jgi:integrase
MYGRRDAREVGPRAFDDFRLRLVRRGSLPRKPGGEVRPLSSTYIRKLLASIRKAFRWGAGREIALASTYEAIRLAPCLQFGEARETEPIEAVDDEVVDATIRFLPQVVADMVRVQRLLGCRPGELVQMRPGDIDRRGGVWRWRLRRHKTLYRGRKRVVPIGPRAQAILLPYMSRPAPWPGLQPAASCATFAAGHGIRDLKMLRRCVGPEQVALTDSCDWKSLFC